MRITIATVGRARGGPIAELFDEYVRRLAWPVSLKEIEIKGALPAAETQAREGQALLAAIPAKARIVVLDGGGTALDSEGLARKLGSWRDQGTAELAFLIGGADGHTAEILEKADLRLSLGPMTWPHRLVRVMLVEQLYRADRILAGHPYHRA
ncbi:MAG: rRNA ((1915)-N(3))-methyltransferase RlmH [Rhodospirillales bacterium]|jgi:23S rRNA (pseudouridine1915-N3)-methyltransferase|nr:rRNA ((1915)-N(3))-methyltransferase RlmH [Rhodospirillales bacterium]